MLNLVITLDHGMERLRGMTQLCVLRWWYSWGWERERWEEIGEINIRNWDIKGCSVRVNLLSPMRQVRVQIRRVLTPINCFLNRTRQDVPLISHIRFYAPHCSHLHPHLSLSCPHLYHHRWTLSEVILLYLSMPRSWVHTKYSILRIQQSPSTESTQDSMSALHSHNDELTHECSFRFWCASLHDWPPSAKLSMTAQSWSHLVTFPPLRVE